MARTWGEFFFGTEESRKKAKDVLKEMRQEGRYSRPNLSNTTKTPIMTGTGRLRPKVKKNIVGNNPNRGLSQGSASTPSGTYFVTPSKTKPKNIVGNNPNRGIGTKKADDFKKKNLAANQKAGKDAASTQAAPKPPKPRLRPSVEPKGMTFQEAVRRNVTEEYIRNKMKPKKSLLGSLRKKGNK